MINYSNSEQPATAIRYARTSWQELISTRPVPWLVDGIIPDKGVAAVYGAPNSGKTYLTLDLLFHICTGVPWFGLKVEQRSVIYIGLEGEGGIPKRIKALQYGRASTMSDVDQVLEEAGRNFCPILGFPFRFEAGENPHVEGLIELSLREKLVRPVVVIDTLALALSGDENDNAVMGEALRQAGNLSRRLDSVVIILHHPSKASPDQMRGASALLGALDTAIKVDRADTGSHHTWRVMKSRDGEVGASKAFKLIPIETSYQSDAIKEVACYVSPDESVVPTKADTEHKKLGANQQVVLDALRKAGAPMRGSELQQVLTAAKPGIEGKRANQATTEALGALVRRGHVKEAGTALTGYTYTLPEWGDLPSAGGLVDGKTEKPEMQKTCLSDQPKAER